MEKNDDHEDDKKIKFRISKRKALIWIFWIDILILIIKKIKIIYHLIIR